MREHTKVSKRQGNSPRAIALEFIDMQREALTWMSEDEGIIDCSFHQGLNKGSPLASAVVRVNVS